MMPTISVNCTQRGKKELKRPSDWPAEQPPGSSLFLPEWLYWPSLYALFIMVSDEMSVHTFAYYIHWVYTFLIELENFYLVLIQVIHDMSEMKYFFKLWLAKCLFHKKLENSWWDGNTRPLYLPPEKQVYRSRSSS